MKLATYHKKRNFKITPEPAGDEAIKSTYEQNIFVIQKHHASHLHYDFRLSINGVLKSWAVPKEPSTDPKVKRLAVATEDHPLEYANFAGTIPEGEYGAGTVEIWDKGYFEVIGNVERSLNDRKIHFLLYGNKLHGEWVLIGLKDQPKNWLLFKLF